MFLLTISNSNKSNLYIQNMTYMKFTHTIISDNSDILIFSTVPITFTTTINSHHHHYCHSYPYAVIVGATFRKRKILVVGCDKNENF